MIPMSKSYTFLFGKWLMLLTRLKYQASKFKLPAWGMSLVLACVVLALIFSLRAAGKFESLELLTYDTLLAHHATQFTHDKRIVMVWNTDEDQRQYGWPLTDGVLTTLLTKILQQKPRVIGLDIYRDLPVPLNNTSQYNALSRLFIENKNIITIEKFIDKHGAKVNPPPSLAGTDQVGFNDLVVDVGGIARRGLFFLTNEEGKTAWSFALRLALRYLAADNIRLTADQKTGEPLLGGYPFPPRLSMDTGGYHQVDNGGYQFLMSYPAAPNTFQHVTLKQIMSGQVSADFFQDKLVIIGTNSDATPDFFYMPIGHERIAGARIHAYSASQLLHIATGQTQAITSLSKKTEQFIIILAALLGALFCLWARTVWRFITVMTVGALLFLAVSYTAFMYNLWMITITPISAWLLSMTVVIAFLSYQEKAQRHLLMHLFSRHVSEEVAQVIWQSREQYLDDGKLLPQRITASVMFTDLQGFTTISENLEPRELLLWLNEYMDSMVTIIEQHHGHVHKFIGDAVMAVFGITDKENTPEMIQENARRSVQCALAMRKEMARLAAHWHTRRLPNVRMRVGICTGSLVTGSLGSVHRQEYTILGDTVNTASRLESFDKTLDALNPCRILISDRTLECLHASTETEYVGEVHLKGKHETVRIHQVLS